MDGKVPIDRETARRLDEALQKGGPLSEEDRELLRQAVRVASGPLPPPGDGSKDKITKPPKKITSTTTVEITIPDP